MKNKRYCYNTIFFNGTSSSGKTSIALKLLKRLNSAWKLLKVDDYLTKGLTIDDFHNAVLDNSRKFNLIIDHVLEKETWYEICKNILIDRKVCWVDVKCSIEILKLREIARGNRLLGLAEKQLTMLYENYVYKPSIVVETSHKTPIEVAKVIETFISTY